MTTTVCNRLGKGYPVGPIIRLNHRVSPRARLGVGYPGLPGINPKQGIPVGDTSKESVDRHLSLHQGSRSVIFQVPQSTACNDTLNEIIESSSAGISPILLRLGIVAAYYNIHKRTPLLFLCCLSPSRRCLTFCPGGKLEQKSSQHSGGLLCFTFPFLQRSLGRREPLVLQATL
jgi:hypothetical protein